MNKQTKTCSKCGIEKELSEFYFRKDKQKHISECKQCINLYYISNKKKITEYKKEYRKSHKEERKEYDKNYVIKYKNRIQENKKRYYQKNKTKLKEYAKTYRENNKINRNQYLYNRKNNDIEFKITCLLRTRICTAIKTQSGIKSYKSIELLGCTIENARNHLESQFTEDMTWYNHGEWHIDHIRPCASFDLTDPEQQKQCFHYTNLQPLWAKDNISKGDKWEEDASPATN